MSKASQLAAVAAREMANELTRAPFAVACLTPVLAWASLRLGSTLARFDDRIGVHGISVAASMTLEGVGAHFTLHGEHPGFDGPLLVVANHPGAYDALLLLASLGRADVGFLAAQREFLRAMPHLGSHLFELGSAPQANLRSLRQAFAHLSAGHVLLHFPAGRIEPDPAFPPSDGRHLLPWVASTGALVRATARARGKVVCALLSGVHSSRAKQTRVNRWAERRGVTTVAPLLQIVLKRFHDVEAVVHLTQAEDAAELVAATPSDAHLTETLRARVLDLARKHARR